MTNNRAKTIPDNCISNLENHVHDVFAGFRISGEDFVYCPNNDLYSKLDDYCDDLTISEIRPPLLIKGEPGTGKTALLANWLHRREHASAKSRATTDEFIFWHAVGCSRQSLSTNYVIKRLISGLKVRFELSRSVPRTQERLSWELPRFLDLASKKGKVIIIIDGIHRLKANDGGEDNLTWLPLELPPNVRMILSATVSHDKEKENVTRESPLSRPGTQHSSQGNAVESGITTTVDGGRKNRVLVELERRQVPYYFLHSLDKMMRKGIIGAFVQNTINTDAVAIATGRNIGALFDSNTSKGINASSDMVAGFLLLEPQIAALLEHKLGGNPWFLRLFLRCLYFVCSRGYSLWYVFYDWIATNSMEELFDHILTTYESGYRKTRESVQQDSDRTIAAGGTPSLRHLYPWHPAFRDRGGNNLQDDNSTSVGGLLNMIHNNGDNKTVQSNGGEEGGNGDGNEHNNDVLNKDKSLSNMVRHNLGDQGWVTVERQVHRQLQMAIIEAQRTVEDGWLSIEHDGKEQLIEEAINKLSNQPDIMLVDMNHMHETPANGLRHRAFSADNSLSSGSLLIDRPTVDIDVANSNSNDSQDDEDGDEGEGDNDSWEDQSMTSMASKRLDNDHNHNQHHGHSHGHHHHSHHRTAGNSSTKHSIGSHSHSHSHSHHNSINNNEFGHSFQSADPSEGFFSLPLYMRGGANISGFGDLLGNALSLLYVVRQGLKEQELWKILAYLQYKAKREKELSQDERNVIKQRKYTIKRHVIAIEKVQNYLENAFRAEDISRTGYIHGDLMLHWIRKHVNISSQEFTDIIEYILTNILTQDNNNNNQSSNMMELFVTEENKIQYDLFFKLLQKVRRKFNQFFAKKRTTSTSTNTNADEEDGDDDPNAWEDEFDDNFDSFSIQINHHDHNNANANGGNGNANGLRTSGGGALLPDEEGNIQSLGPVVEELLLLALRALGVLYSAENKVLILSSDSELFRKIIYTRYILPRGLGTVQYWHNLIIQYFRTQPNSLRKCEELPWHLKICRKWTSLKDTLVDLRTFDLMFNNDLRDELMEYWLLLSEGPLYVHDTTPTTPCTPTAAAVLTPTDNNNNPTNSNSNEEEDSKSAFSHILREIDESIALHIPLKLVRRRLHQNQMQPFDVVEELNHSVEAWVTTERPTPSNLYRTIHQIALFLLEFAKHVHSSPQFRRIGINMSVMNQFGVSLSDLKDAMTLATALTNSIPTSNDDNNGNGITTTTNNNTIANTTGLTSNTNKMIMENKYFDKSQPQQSLQPKEEEDNSKFPTQSMVISNFYLYLRWIWIQFPWLALHLAATINTNTNTSNKLYSLDSNHMNLHQDEVVGGGGGGGGSGMLLKDGGDESNNLTASATATAALLMKKEQEEKNLLRVWNAKKSDPTIPVFVSSENRKLAAVKPRTSLSSSLERNVSVSCKNLYEELARPSHIAQVRLGLVGFQRDKFRRTFEEEMELAKNIPFGYHGKRTIAKGSLFPSFEAALREKHQKKMASENDLYDEDEDNARNNNGNGNNNNKNMNNNGNNNISPSKKPNNNNSGNKSMKKKLPAKFNLEEALKTGGSTFFLTEIDDEIRRITSEEYLQSHRNERSSGSSLLIKDELDLEYDSLLDRIARMKTISNKLLLIYREKKKCINDLENAIQIRQESDVILMNEVTQGEMLIKSLHERNVLMEKNVKEAVIIEDGYNELLKTLKLNPPYHETHVQSLELEVSLANKQFHDLCLHRAKIYDDSYRLETMKKNQLLERIKYYQSARQEIGMKKKQIVKEMKKLNDILGDHTGKYMNMEQLKQLFHENTLAGEPFSRNANHISSDSDDSSGNEGENHGDSASEIHLTQPVKHFLNALVRKVTYNEPIIQDTDTSLSDVKKRAQSPAMRMNNNTTSGGKGGNNAAHRMGMRNLNRQRTNLKRAGDPSSPPIAPMVVIQHTLSMDGLGAMSADYDSMSNNQPSIVLSSAGSGSGNGGGGGSGGGIRNNRNISFYNNNNINPNSFYTNNNNNNISNNNNNYNNNNNGMNGLNSNNNNNNINNMMFNRKKLTSKQIAQIRDAVQDLLDDPNNAHHHQNYPNNNPYNLHNHATNNVITVSPADEDRFKRQVQKAVRILFQQTESSNCEDFLERYLQDQALLESLTSQQILADSRLAQLRAEHAELTNIFSDMTFSAEENKQQQQQQQQQVGAPSAVGGIIESLPNVEEFADLENQRDNRFLDNQLFAKEVRFHHYQRLYDNTVHTVSEVRTAIAHVMRLLTINAKLLAGLPRTIPPKLECDADMANCLSWCEDRIIALNEALTMDANRPANANEENKPIAQRQMELASLVYEMNSPEKKRGGVASSTKRKQHGNMSKALINNPDTSTFVSSPRGVMVTAANKIDKTYDSKVGKLLAERDKRSDVYDNNKKTFNKRDNPSAHEAQRFLSEGLNRKVTKNMSREAKLLVNKRSGRTASYGLVLEELMASRGEEFDLTEKSKMSPHISVTAAPTGGGGKSGAKNAHNAVTNNAEESSESANTPPRPGSNPSPKGKNYPGNGLASQSNSTVNLHHNLSSTNSTASTTE